MKYNNNKQCAEFDLGPVLINIIFYRIYSLCKNIAISKVLNKLQVFHFRSTVHTNTTPTVITH